MIAVQVSFAKALTVSQFLYRSTPAAISAVIAIITRPIGLVRNAIAAPRAVVTVVAIAQTAFQAAVAAVMAASATVSAIFAAVLMANCAACFTSSTVPFASPTTKSLAYIAMSARLSRRSFSIAPAWVRTSTALALNPFAMAVSIDGMLAALIRKSLSFDTSHTAKKPPTSPAAVSKSRCDLVSQSTTPESAQVNASNTGFATKS